MDTLRRLAFKYRGGIWTVLFVFILFLAHPSVERVCWGGALVALGQILRCWAAGCIIRYRGEVVDAKDLVTWGPYALVRNPLYIGNGLIGLGWSVMAGSWTIFLFTGVFIALYGLLIIPYEETFLEDVFGERYIKFKRDVGRFFPKFPLSWRKLRGNFYPSVILKSEIYSLKVTVVGTLVLVSRLWW